MRTSKQKETAPRNETLDRIRNICRSGRFLKTLRSFPGFADHFWLQWYTEYIQSLGIFRFIPYRFCKNGMNRLAADAFRAITDNGIVVCKEIRLPLPEKEALQTFWTCIMDNIFTYLLDDLGEEFLCFLFSSHPGWTEGPYEYKTVRLQKGDIVIDAGAYIGEFSAMAGVRGCTVYAFEPTPQIADKYLTKTSELNPHITLCRYAFSDKPGELILGNDSHRSIIDGSARTQKSPLRLICLPPTKRHERLPLRSRKKLP